MMGILVPIRCFIWTAAAICSPLAQSPPDFFTIADHRALAGIDGVWLVSVIRVEDGVLHPVFLEDLIEVELRRAGITIYDDGKGKQRQTYGRGLQIIIGTRRPDNEYGWSEYTVKVQITDTVIVSRQGGKKKVVLRHIPVWEAHASGTSFQANRSEVEDVLRQILTRFSNDFLKANPRRK